MRPARPAAAARGGTLPRRIPGKSVTIPPDPDPTAIAIPKGLLARLRGGAGETIVRFVDDHGDIGELVLDGSGHLIRSREAGSVFEARILAEERDRAGRYIRIARDVSGALVRYAVAFDGEAADVQVLSAAK